MLFSKSSPLKKIRTETEELLRIAHRIYHYRRDVIAEKDLERLIEKTEALEVHYRDKNLADVKPFRKAIRELDPILKKTGGNFYPRTTLAEYTDVFLVTAFLAIGIRTFFAQPFKIPTNSMYPTYNGMTYQMYATEEERPNLLQRIVRKGTLWSKNYHLTAPVDGEVLIPFRVDANGRLTPKGKPSNSRLPFLGGKVQYTLVVGTEKVTIDLPRDFRFDKLLAERFKHFQATSTSYFKTGVFLKKGDIVVSFDILTGDMLFVDRFTYHFRKPRVGEPFVFRTAPVPGLEDDKYYIKRLVGMEGDTLEVRRPALYRNGNPIEGAKAFNLNSSQHGEYEGYAYAGYKDIPQKAEFYKYALFSGDTVAIGPQSYFAMGDNSDESFDSRYWGEVPQEALVGKALFIYYPFTRRWGPAQ